MFSNPTDDITLQPFGTFEERMFLGAEEIIGTEKDVISTANDVVRHELKHDLMPPKPEIE